MLSTPRLSLILVHALTLTACSGGTSVGDQGGGFLPGFPFATYSGHTVTQDPEDHTYTDKLNWDIDCQVGQGIGTVVGGVVRVAQDGVDTGYGNRVCVYSATWDIQICHNHMDESSLTVTEGEEVALGDHIGNCGNSGSLVAENGGDGSHVDVYAITGSGENYSLPDPMTWAPLATLNEPGTSPSCSGQFRNVEVERDVLVVEATVGCDAGVEKWSVVEGEGNTLFSDWPSDAATKVDISEEVDLEIAGLDSGRHTPGLWVRPAGGGESALLDDMSFSWTPEGDTGEICDSHAYTQCSGGDVYWYDSCDNQEEIEDNCYSSETCVETSSRAAECQADSTDPVCDSHSYTQCSGGDVYWYDSCGDQEEIQDNCSSSETCENTSDESAVCKETCSSHSYTQCSGGDVYWYDSCGDREEIQDNCSSSETCENTSDESAVCKETCSSHSYTQCSGGDVYWYDSCDTREEVAESCGDTTGCEETSSSSAECTAEAVDHTDTPTDCGSSSRAVFTAVDVSISDASYNPYVTVTWEKCDGSTVSESKSCDIRVGSYADYGTVRTSFSITTGHDSWTTAFYGWPSTSDFAEDECGTTKEFYMTCDDGGIEAYWRSDSPVEIEKTCP